MDHGNRAFRERGGAPIFSATLTPHRSLSRVGGAVLIASFGAVCIVVGVSFWLLGAWPVGAFLGLDVAAVALAFGVNGRAARAYEAVEVTPTALTISKVSAAGRAQEFRFNPRWVRIDVREVAGEGVARFVGGLRGAGVAVGAFLNPVDRTSFARALQSALAATRR